MAQLFTQTQNNITSLTSSIIGLQADITNANTILSSGTNGTDVYGDPIVTYNGVTYSVAALNKNIADYNAQIVTYQNALTNYQNQIPLASTVDTPTVNPQTSTVVRSYQHASRIFVDSNYRLSPKYGFLFYVEFDFDPLITNVSNTSAQELGMIVKSVSLPKFTIDTKIHNAYNRKNIVQNKINYDPINITFHDDQADNVRNFWYDYYSFFYRDSDYADSTYGIINKYQERPTFEWGYSPRPVGSYNSAAAYQNYQYIQAIRIYSLYQGNFDEYELINPTITRFQHGEHTNGDNNLLEHQMTVQFETVKYQTGYTTQNTVGGFIDLHYDSTPSPNGGTPQSETNSSTITDLANYNLQTSGGAVVPPPNTAAIAGALSVSSVLSGALSIAGASGSNAGGFAIPSLGSLTAGISNSNIIGQQLSAATVSLAGSAATTLAGGVVKGVAQGLGSNGTQIVGLAAAAIANPSAALQTVEGMAVKFAMGAATNAVNSLSAQAGQYLTTQISQGISTGLGDLNSSLAFGGASTFTGGVSNALGEFQASFSFGGADDAQTASLFSDSSSYSSAAGWSN